MTQERLGSGGSSLRLPAAVWKSQYKRWSYRHRFSTKSQLWEPHLKINPGPYKILPGNGQGNSNGFLLVGGFWGLSIWFRFCDFFFLSLSFYLDHERISYMTLRRWISLLAISWVLSLSTSHLCGPLMITSILILCDPKAVSSKQCMYLLRNQRCISWKWISPLKLFLAI